MDKPLEAHSLNEIGYYLMVRPCHNCGKGPLVADDAPQAPNADRSVLVEVRCTACDHTELLRFVCDHDVPATGGSDSQAINPTGSPSCIIDLGQWLSLFYLLVESAAAKPAAAEVRRVGYEAALCLVEALKFYGDDELPPESAFFLDQSREAYAAHPEKFARQKLRDMRSKLPALPVMAKRVGRDHQAGRKKWWQFWR